jgi:hypothetical protein
MYVMCDVCFFMDRADKRTPYAYAEVDLNKDEDWQFDTDPDERGGVSPYWNGLDMAGCMEGSKLQRDHLRIRAKTFADGKDVFIGKASISGVRFTENLNRIVEISGALISNDDESETGKFIIRGRFRDEAFDDSGFLDVSMVEVSKLDNTSGLFEGKQDPFAELKVGDGSKWSHKTDPAVDGGRNASWSLQLSGPMSQRDIAGGTVKLRIRAQKSDGSAEVIGMAVVSDGLALFGPNENKWVTLSGDLLEEDGKSPAGQYTVVIKYRPLGTERQGDDSALKMSLSPRVALDGEAATLPSQLPNAIDGTRAMVGVGSPQSGVFEIFAIELSGLQSTSKRITIIL